MAGSVGFVGREGELPRLHQAVGGEVRLLLVVGDAGIGKTRFVAEGLDTSPVPGLVALWGGCLPLSESLPLLPIAEALEGLSRVDGGALIEAALAATRRYVRVEVERLVPELGNGGAQRWGRHEGGQRERLFAAIAELLDAVADQRPVAVVIEDVQWADSATLDCLTFLTRRHRGSALGLIATCRTDEALVDEVADWLGSVRGNSRVAEISLGPLSRSEVAGQVAVLQGAAPSTAFLDELYARAGGNPFFTQQLMAAAESGGRLPARLAQLLVARVQRCGTAAWTVLAALAVAGRGLDEQLLGAVSELDAQQLRAGLHALTAARLLAETGTAAEYRPRHALLAEAVAAELLVGERVGLHERLAGALQARADETLAAEVAGHWAAAGHRAEELPTRVAAAEAAERLVGYADAARHWQRASELFQTLPSADRLVEMDLPALYLRQLAALETAGAGEQARAVAVEAFHRFAEHPDPAIAARIHLHTAIYRANGEPVAVLPQLESALRLFEQAPPSAEHAQAWLRYGTLHFAQGRLDAHRAAVDRARQIAEQAHAGEVRSWIDVSLAWGLLARGALDEGLATLHRAHAAAEAAADSEELIIVAANEAAALTIAADFDRAVTVALEGLRIARETGRQASGAAKSATANAAQALLWQGRTAEAAALIESWSPGPVDYYALSGCCAEIDLLRGDFEGAVQRLEQLAAAVFQGGLDLPRNQPRRIAEILLWTGRPEDALAEVRRVLNLYQAPKLTILIGRLLTAGMRACADLAERSRARQDQAATRAAIAAGGELHAWVVDRMGGTPFTDHPLMATIPAERASWEAERTRLAGSSDPAAWAAAAKTWQDLGCPHRAGYAWWRHAEARLLAGQPPGAAAAALRTAVLAADGHNPLQAVIGALADRAHLTLDTALGDAQAAAAEPPHEPTPYGLTKRELAVLRLLAAGLSNTQIGAALFISRKTVSAHVSTILRKLGVATRVQAAAVAERAGLLDA